MRKQLLPGLFKNTNPFGYKFCHMHKNMKLEEEISCKVLLRSSYISIREGASVFVKKRYDHLDFPHFKALFMWRTICLKAVFSHLPLFICLIFMNIGIVVSKVAKVNKSNLNCLSYPDFYIYSWKILNALLLNNFQTSHRMKSNEFYLFIYWF